MTKFTVVAECASQHGGDLGLAKKYIEEAKRAGATTAKFQYFNVADGFFPREDPRFGQVERAQLSLDQLGELWDRCEDVGIGFLVTPFKTVERVEELASLGLRRVKIREADSKNKAMVKRALDLFAEVYISATEIPIDPFLMYHPHIRWLYTIPRYPASMEDLDLGRVASFGGYSNHIPDIVAPLAVASVAQALGKGTFLMEVHATLSHSDANLDRVVSLDFSELSRLVRHLRAIGRIGRKG